jgi:hypothetical protein
MNTLSSRGVTPRSTVRRVGVDDVPADLATFDYADAFELTLPVADRRPAEEWLRSGLEEAPAAVRQLIRWVHRHVLGFDLAPADSPDHVLGWAVVSSEADACRLETASPLFRAAILGQRRSSTTVTLQTVLHYRSPAARWIWRVVGPLHRGIAPVLLGRAARGR